MIVTRALTALLLAAGLALPASAAEVRISQSDKAFSPADVAVKAGDTVIFVNDDGIPHNVFSKTAGAAFNLGVLKPGDEQRVTFGTRAVVDVSCAIHPRMKLSITVE